MAASSFRAAQQQRQQGNGSGSGSAGAAGGLSSYSREPGPGSSAGILFNGNASSSSSSNTAMNTNTNGGYFASTHHHQQTQGGSAMSASRSNGSDRGIPGGAGYSGASTSMRDREDGQNHHQQHQYPSQPGPSSNLMNLGQSSSNGGGSSSSSSQKMVANSPEEVEQSRNIARTHYEEFKIFLEQEGMRDANARVNAREKLTRLTRQQFQELSTDVYDELVRRQRTRNVSPTHQTEFLPVKPEFHPKRNQARQKLATLPKVRFRDLASDVYFELERRYPEFRESEVPEPQEASYTSQQGMRGPSPSSSQRRPQYVNQGQSMGGSVANEVIIPNKSTLVEEDVGMPPSSSTNSMAGPSQQSGLGRSRGYSASSNNENTSSITLPRKSGERDRAVSPSNYDREPISPVSASGGRKSNDLPRLNGQQATSPDWVGNSLSRASEASSIGTRLVGAYGGSSSRSDAGGDWEREQHVEELEKLRSDYEFRIATMQNRLQGLERDLDDSKTRESAKIKSLENQLDKMEERHEDSLQNIQQLERELAEAQDQQNQIPPYPADNSADKDEIARLRNELASVQRSTGRRSDVEDNLKREMEGLLDTLREMNVRQDELASEREADQARIEDLLSEVQDWKKRYESAKTELRNLKATSQLFVKPTKADDDYMPTSSEGAIIDSHVTTFQSSIDDLLIGGRSNAPSSVIIATKQVINAVARIDEDVQEYEASGRAEHLPPDDRERLHALKSKCNATLSNLTTAARTHATGHGLSPVSLLDAAASHLSVTIIELVRLLHLRKAGTALPALVDGASNGPRHTPSDSASSRHTQQAASHSSQASRSSQQQQQQQSQQASRNAPASAYPARSGSLRPFEGSTSQNQQQQPNGRLSPAQSMRSRVETASPDPDRSATPQDPQRGMQASASARSLAASVHTNNSYASRQQSYGDARGSDGQPSARAEQRPDFADEDEEEDQRRQQQQSSREADEQDGEADWNELKNYLEAQTEAIVQSITALLAAIRGGAQANKLEENLSQIITIVSSIVAILRENLPSALHSEAEPIITDLSDNCDKLVDLQNTANGPGATFSKQTKQQMATASFGIAKSLKAMNGILSTGQ